MNKLKKVLFAITTIGYFVGSYYLGNFLTQSFDEPIDDKLIGTLFGMLILIFAIFIIVIIYVIYNEIFDDE